MQLVERRCTRDHCQQAFCNRQHRQTGTRFTKFYYFIWENLEAFAKLRREITAHCLIARSLPLFPTAREKCRKFLKTRTILTQRIGSRRQNKKILKLKPPIIKHTQQHIEKLRIRNNLESIYRNIFTIDFIRNYFWNILIHVLQHKIKVFGRNYNYVKQKHTLHR